MSNALPGKLIELEGYEHTTATGRRVYRWRCLTGTNVPIHTGLARSGIVSPTGIVGLLAHADDHGITVIVRPRKPAEVEGGDS